MKKPFLREVHCCGQLLAEAMSNTSIYCPVCNRWQHVAGAQGDKLNEAENPEGVMKNV